MNNYSDFEEAFAERSPKYTFLIKQLRTALNKEQVLFDDINTINLRKFKKYMETRVTANSLKTYFAPFSAFVRECHNDGLIANDKCLSVLKVHKEPQQNVALTEEEVKRIQEYHSRLFGKDQQAEKDVVTLFLIECYSGARSCDVERFTPDNIKDGVLSYVSQKTKVLAKMPAHKFLPELVAQIPKKKYYRCTKTRIIKRVCKRCGIDTPITIMYHGEFTARPKYEYCGTHTARRSYVTNLLNRGVPISTVSKLAGHTNVEMTLRYYCTDEIKLDDNTMDFFK